MGHYDEFYERQSREYFKKKSNAKELAEQAYILERQIAITDFLKQGYVPEGIRHELQKILDDLST